MRIGRLEIRILPRPVETEAQRREKLLNRRFDIIEQLGYIDDKLNIPNCPFPCDMSPEALAWDSGSQRHRRELYAKERARQKR